MVKLPRLSPAEAAIQEKVEAGIPLTDDDALALYHSDNLAYLGTLASIVRERLHGKVAFYNRNFHIEPTNICIYECAFCSFARKPGEEGGWEYTPEEIENIAAKYVGTGVTEVHIVGGVHPKRGIEYYADIIRRIKRILPNIHVKAFTAVELKVMCARSRMSYKEGLLALREAGLDSLPGGGAEIFHPEIRRQICATKASTEEWIEIHRTAHELGIPSNATMLYGHIERYEHRVHHMRLLRELQAETGGFNCFIPLKYRRENNALSHLSEVSIIEDLKNYAVSRLYLNNIPHLKAYWPMIGRVTAQLSLSFGVDDLDGTIDDTTKIYSMAGAEEHPTMSTEEIAHLISSAGYIPQERDSIYRPIHPPSVVV
ncbi:MAG: aminofutalosine synthase MqnE [Bacteroidia bacterium]|nr:aminofutalosine synthase MqnE [Bacteroidia bacterium]MCX7651740.1 aminofutalosine synthase MqnE [Bacteroidia bacterium]MDW8417380.1 aminofutalosine synthase MqnE [Bacteroidia bacterium]